MVTALSAVGVSKRFGRTVAVDGVDLEARSGEVLALLGPNGAGKTTLMKMFLGLVGSDAGELTIGGLPVTDPRSRRRVTYLPENLDLPSWSTPSVFSRHISRLRGDGGAMRSRLGEMAGLMECDDLLDRSFGKMSRGQRQRCLVAALASGDPEILLLDEPSSGLDPAGRFRLRSLLRELASSGATVMINSHLLGEVERTCDHAAFISRGRLIARGNIDELSLPTGAAEITTADPERMSSVLEASGYSVESSERALRVALTGGEERFRLLASDVLESGVPFTGIRLVREDLEQVFLRLTGEAG